MTTLYVFEMKGGFVPDTTYVTKKGIKLFFIAGKTYVREEAQLTLSALQEECQEEGCPVKPSIPATVDSSELDPTIKLKKEFTEQLLLQVTDPKVKAAVEAAIAKVLPRNIGETSGVAPNLVPKAMEAPEAPNALQALLQSVSN